TAYPSNGVPASTPISSILGTLASNRNPFGGGALFARSGLIIPRTRPWRISMIARLYRPLTMGLLPIALIACMNSPPTAAEASAAVPLGIDLGGSGLVLASAQPALPARAVHAEAQAASPQRRDTRMAHDGHNDAHGTGTVNSVDPAQHKVNLSHNPIPEIGWP